MDIHHREYSVANKKGLSLFYQSWASGKRAPLKTAHIVHGLGDHTGCYEQLAQFLVSRDFIVYGLDMHGFGRSEGRRGHAQHVEDHIGDLKLLHIIMQQKDDLAPRSLIYGQSYGGLLVLAYLEKYPDDYTHAIISAPALNPARNVNPLLLVISAVCSPFLPAVPFHNRINPDQITEDPDAQDTYRDDSLAHHTITPRLFTGMRRLSVQVQENLRLLKKDLNILFIHGDADEITDHHDTVSFFERIPIMGKRIEIIRGMKHDPLSYIGGEPAFEVFSDWLDTVEM
jgi:acylglycerol lipase